MAVPDRVYELVERFDRSREAYLRNYNETQVRGDFIDPLLEELGWDVHNRQGYPEAYRQVIEEDKLKIGGGTKAPDYGFYVGGIRKFYLEAKQPSVDIAGDLAPAVQLRRYAWTAQLPLSIVSDFEEFAFYDCRFEPQKTDKATTARLDHITYDKYADRWDQIYSVFSYEAVRDGSLDKFAETTKRKRGTQTVDDAFLGEIEGWRAALARELATSNDLNRRQLNHAVQMTIDRIIFLRMAEDRGIEDYGRLLQLTKGPRVYDYLCELFREADDRYNSGLFHFRERDRKDADHLTLGLKIGDTLLRNIIKGLYYPDSPYEFGVLPEDVLGQVYERFLGKVIRLEDGGHRAVIEEKPEVRKAGGVYYTPTYIVDYIVEHTVGELLEKKTPEQVSKLKIVDPACGSGSFLLGAYKCLLDWHCNYYLGNGSKKYLKRLYQGAGGRWMLTIDEKKRILLNNIYGVDIDPQAVEVTKLSLLLKVLEGESEQTLEAQLKMFHERALPDLDNNIKSGNSLVGSDFYEDYQMMLLDEEEHYRINVFDWQAAFPQVFTGDTPGFDAVIGNPPYGAFFGGEEKQYLFNRYPAIKGQPESYEYFLYEAVDLAKPTGFVSFIVPTNFVESDRAEGLRETLLVSGQILLLSNFRYNVWSKNAAETLVLTFQKGVHDGSTIVVHPTTPAEFTANINAREVNQQDWRELPKQRFLIRGDAKLVGKIEREATRLVEICDISQGIIVYKTREQSQRNPYIADRAQGPKWKKLLDTKSKVERFNLVWGHRYLKYGHWLWCPRDERYFSEPKLVFVRLRNKSLDRKLVATYDDQQFYNRDNFNNIISKDSRYSLKYILGLFNSTLLNYWYKAYFDNVNINPAQVRLLPIHSIDFANPKDIAEHNRMVELVEWMLILQEKLSAAKIDQEKTVIQQQINATDRQIDRLVYKLYGLTEEEIEVVEGG